MKSVSLLSWSSVGGTVEFFPLSFFGVTWRSIKISQQSENMKEKLTTPDSWDQPKVATWAPASASVWNIESGETVETDF